MESRKQLLETCLSQEARCMAKPETRQLGLAIQVRRLELETLRGPIHRWPEVMLREWERTLQSMLRSRG